MNRSSLIKIWKPEDPCANLDFLLLPFLDTLIEVTAGLLLEFEITTYFCIIFFLCFGAKVIIDKKKSIFYAPSWSPSKTIKRAQHTLCMCRSWKTLPLKFQSIISPLTICRWCLRSPYNWHTTQFTHTHIMSLCIRTFLPFLLFINSLKFLYWHLLMITPLKAWY